MLALTVAWKHASDRTQRNLRLPRQLHLQEAGSNARETARARLERARRVDSGVVKPEDWEREGRLRDGW